jgi:hypothetical protein
MPEVAASGRSGLRTSVSKSEIAARVKRETISAGTGVRWLHLYMVSPRAGQWHEAVPVSVKLLPDSDRNCQLYD